MIVKISNIPKQYRSANYKGVVPVNSLLPVNTSNGSNSSAGAYTPPYYIDANGDLVFNQKKFWFDDEYIDESKIITWDEAVDLKHQHDNWEQIRTINQNLSATSTPSFTGLNITNQANVWRLNVTGGLVMNNKTISEVNTIGFQPYEKDGVMFTNIITNQNSGGIRINCPIKVEGSFELMGSNRDFYSYNYDMNIIHYTYDWRKGSRLTLTDTAVVTDNLSVTGSFNCFELVANKVRSTNGLLYVTDSATVKEMTGDKLVVIFTEYNLKVGDYLLMQTFTGNSIVKKLIKLTYQSPNDGNHFTYHIVGSNGELIRPQDANSAWLPAVNDYFVKIDSEDLSRRTGILLSPYNGGYIDFYTGAGNGVNRYTTTSIGNLDHLGIPGVRGVGLYTDNGFFKGRLVFNTNIITPESTNTIIDLTIDQQVVIKVPYDMDINIGAGVEGQTAKIIAMLSPNKRLSIGCIIDNKLQLLDGLPPHYFALILPNNSSVVKVSIVDLLYSSTLKRSDGNAEYSGWVVTNLHNAEIDYTII